MKAFVTPALLALSLALGACSSRSSDDGELDGADAGTPDAGAEQTPVTDAGGDASPLAPVPDVTDAEALDPIFAPDGSTPDAIDDIDDVDDIDPLDPIFSPDGSVPGDIDETDGLDPIFAPDTFTPDPIGTVDPDDVGVGNPPDVFDDVTTARPAFPGRLGVERLYVAMSQVLGNTLLDLNRRLAEGTLGTDTELTLQQNDCLGSFDGALGESVLAIDCERALATEPYAVYVTRGAFAATDECRAGVAANDTRACVLVAAEMTVRTSFVIVPGERRPVPADGSGIVVRYGIEPGVFEVGDDDDALGPDFDCGYDAASGAALVTNRGDCDRLVGAAADFVDGLIDGAVPAPLSRDRSSG